MQSMLKSLIVSYSKVFTVNTFSTNFARIHLEQPAHVPKQSDAKHWFDHVAEDLNLNADKFESRICPEFPYYPVLFSIPMTTLLTVNN